MRPGEEAASLSRNVKGTLGNLGIKEAGAKS